ncbi:tetratricopeptide repeat protein [Tautonia sociabilis]|uniref:Tetratricopeptide repeat protein n=1 Tax=Tautonia sociabilis TaxID=2080755 RepID=A0A432MM55_9BACT|nr:tetratricopeptide repeat protein [Tautonia sociabilis]RUL88492.1 hypothetical protein TsocGM_07200 [Tautonia sociabilis]
MFAPLFVCALAIASLDSPPPDPPSAWTVSGEWLAFSVALPGVGRAFETIRILPDRPGGDAAPRGDDRSMYRIWAVRVADGKAVKVAEGPGALSSPAWGPDGRSLAFARVVSDREPGPGRWEVVVGYGQEQEVVFSRTLAEGEADALRDRWPGEAVAWDPVDRLIVVPGPDRLGLSIIDLDRREVRREIPGARLASIAPAGGRIAFYRERGDRWELVLSRVGGWEADDRPLDLVEAPVQAPVWTADGRAILYLERGSSGPEGIPTQLSCVRVEGEAFPEKIKEVEAPLLSQDRFLGAYLTVGVDGIEQYYSVLSSSRPSALARHRGNQPFDRVFPFQGLGRVGAPVLSPSGDRIAFRFSGAKERPGTVVGLIDTESKEVTPLAPAIEETACWIAALAEAADLPESPAERPTLLPFPGDLERSGLSPTSYKRLGELGRRLTDEVIRALGADPKTERATLFFSYLAGDYEEAERSLSVLASIDPESADASLRLLGLRAQLRLAQGQDAEAREILEFIEEQAQGDRDDQPPRARVERDGLGRMVEEQLPPEHPWLQALQRLQARSGEEPPEEEPSPRPGSASRVVSPFERPATPRSIDPSPERRPPGANLP